VANDCKNPGLARSRGSQEGNQDSLRRQPSRATAATLASADVGRDAAGRATAAVLGFSWEGCWSVISSARRP
jgi:hypothetical protein